MHDDVSRLVGIEGMAVPISDLRHRECNVRGVVRCAAANAASVRSRCTVESNGGLVAQIGCAREAFIR